MAAITKASAKSYFTTGSKPLQTQFEDLVDSYQDTSSILTALASGNPGIPYVAASALSMVSAGDFGRAFLAADATADGLAQLGGGAAGLAIFGSGTVASAQTELGISTFGAALVSAATTASGQALLGLGASDTATFAGINLGNEDLTTYDEGTWTPVLTFATPGDLSVAYSSQAGTYTQIGNLIFVACQIVTTTFTYSGAASGNLRVTGLPAPVVSGTNMTMPLIHSNINLSASYTTVVANPVAGQSYVEFVEVGDNNSYANITTAKVTSGQQLTLFFSGVYRTA